MCFGGCIGRLRGTYAVGGEMQLGGLVALMSGCWRCAKEIPQCTLLSGYGNGMNG